MRLFALSALLSSTLLAASPAFADTSAEFHQPARSFAGAFLAAATARNDNNFATASRYYDEALRFDPENDGLKQELMVSLLTDGQFDTALDHARDLRDDPSHERLARLAIGLDELRQGEFAAAMDSLLITNQNDLERLLTGVINGWARQGMGETDAAIEDVLALRGPDWFSIFQTYHSALIAAAAGDMPRAEQLFEDGMSNTAGSGASPLTYLRMAEAYGRMLQAQGRTEDAISAIERGLAIAPTNPSLLALSDAVGTGEEIAAPKLSSAQGAGEILLNLGSAINRNGAEAFAALYLEMGRAVWPDEPQILFELGSTAERLEQTEKAIQYYSAVPLDSSLHRVAALQQGLALSDLDRNDEAKETLRDLIAESPDDFRGYMALGGVHAFLKEFGDAAGVYEEALTRIDTDDPRYWTMHYRLGIAYERTKQWPKAETAFKKALELSPDQPDVLNYLGYSWIDMNMNLEEGLDMIQKAVNQRPRDGYIVDSLGWAHYRLGNFEKAVTELEKATNLRPRDPTINDHLADAYWRVGRKLEALHHWARVLDMESDDVDFDLVRAKIEAANAPASNPVIATSIVDTTPSGVAEAGDENDDG